jgi:hypothetical protein
MFFFDFQRSGTYHILVPSGPKVGILVLGTFWLLRRLRVNDFVASTRSGSADSGVRRSHRRRRARLGSDADAHDLRGGETVLSAEIDIEHYRGAAVLLLLMVNPRAFLGQLSAQFLMRADHGKNVVVALGMRTPITWAGRQPCWRTSSP